MRMLRSQYLQYQNSVTTTLTAACKQLNNAGTQITGAAPTGAAVFEKTTNTVAATNAGGGFVHKAIGSQRRRSVFISAMELNGRTTSAIAANREGSSSVGDCNMRCKQRLLSAQPTIICAASVVHPQPHPHCGQQPTLQLNFHNISRATAHQINIVLHFYDEDSRWYTEIYRKHENRVWRRLPRGGEKKHMRWYFECRVCLRLMCSFVTLKGHLNKHMDFYPHRCDVCPKKYPSQNSLTKHLRAFHQRRAMITQT